MIINIIFAIERKKKKEKLTIQSSAKSFHSHLCHHLDTITDFKFYSFTYQ